MLKKSYIVIGSIFFCLLFSFNAKAATTTVQASIPVTNGSNLTIYTQSYTDIYAEDIGQEGGGSDTYGVFKPSFNIQLYGMNQQYLNGYFAITVNINCSVSGYLSWSYDGLDYIRPYNTEGLHVYIAGNAYNYFRLYVIFDNYWNESGSIDLGTVIPKHQVIWGDITPYKANFTTSFSIYTNSIERDQYIQNDRTTELIYNAIYQATGPQLLNIVNTLSAINAQDYTYYTQLVTKLNQLHTDNTQLHTDLTSILNELDLDFQQVQTILDLFPSYRTQVLQYWQQLLEMNAAQSSAAAEMQNEYQNKETQSAQLVNGLGSLNLPSVDANDFNILGNVDSNSKANFFGLIGLITNNSLITTILIIIVTGAIVGYALYGKK
jgi:hypothetical protein